MMRIIDADGHVNDGASVDEIACFMPQGFKLRRIFPEFDHLHFYYLSKGSRSSNPGPDVWVDFLDRTEIEWTVVYPGAGLATGRIISRDWAVAACRAYNNWLYEKFLKETSRIKGMALLPIQDVDQAIGELVHCVKELGMVGGMLPSNGEGIKSHLGSEIYWPLYEEAEKLGCALAVHGGCHHHFGMDGFSAYYPVHALGHPFGIMVQAAAMLSHGIFERFPKIRVAFLEGGSTWVPFFMDRMNRSYQSHVQYNIAGETLPGPAPGEHASDYFRRHVQAGRIFVGFDCDDNGLGYAVRRAGAEPFLFASDFPHENFSAASCRGEIDELLAREDLKVEDKQKILAGNAERLYGAAC